VIDLHCHALPGVDDGPRDMAAALALARRQLAVGVTTVAATPHVCWDLPTDAPLIAAGVEDLRAALRDDGLPLRIVTGAEIDVHRAAELPDEALRQLALGGGPWLLIESPLQRAPQFEDVVRDLLDRGHAVMLAHPERSPLIQREPFVLHRLVNAGAITQLTASSFTGRFGRTVQQFAEQLLADGLVHSVASDAHDAVRRPPGMRDALLAADFDEELIELLTKVVPGAVLDGDTLPHVGRRALRHRRGLRTLLRRRAAAS
jgi:protein-tyrosine phosphatase